MEPERNELKPCPFCGSELEFQHWHLDKWNIICKTCKASCEQGTTKLGAIKAWNTMNEKIHNLITRLNGQ